MTNQVSGTPSLPGERAIAVGETVGEYVIECELGRGAFGTVYRAIHPVIGKQVAVKVLSLRYSIDPSIVSRFVAEARAVNQIGHKNIIDIFSFGELPDGRRFYVMEYLRGRTLERELAKRSVLPASDALDILEPLARALDAAHAKGIAHRDLKPANVLLGRDDDGAPFPKLLDFGIAKLMSDDLPRQHHTGTGAVVGTPQYMSPEQCRGDKVDHRTDYYSFGVMAYQMLTGRLPFDGPSAVHVLSQHMSAPPPPPSRYCQDLPEPMERVLLALLEKDREKRPLDLRSAVVSMRGALSEPRGSTSPQRRAIESNPMMEVVVPPTMPPEADSGLDATFVKVEAGKRRWAGAGVGLLLAGGFALAAAWSMGSFEPKDTDARNALPAVERRVSEPSPRGEGDLGPGVPPPNAAPQTVRVELLGLPADAEVRDPTGSVRLVGPGAFEIERASTELVLTIDAPGHWTASRTIVPEDSISLTVTLEPAPALRRIRPKQTSPVTIKPRPEAEKSPAADDLTSWE